LAPWRCRRSRRGLAYALEREAAAAERHWRRGHGPRASPARRQLPGAEQVREVDLVIAGGGVAGLSAGWRLTDAGFARFKLLELEDNVGGNARSGRNAVSAYPLGAHYLPVANREAKALQHLLRQLGMITGDSGRRAGLRSRAALRRHAGTAVLAGRWQEGLIPRTGHHRTGQGSDLAAFETAMTAFSKRVGSDGKPAFALPMAYSSRDADLIALDTIELRRMARRQGWHSPVLRAHVRYAMRDDYGTEPDQVSAWAGVHYFAGRRGWAANGSGDNELTWPEGNGRLVRRQLAGFFPQRVAAGNIVHRVSREGDRILVDSFDVAANATVRTSARAAILAMPHFVATRGSARDRRRQGLQLRALAGRQRHRRSPAARTRRAAGLGQCVEHQRFARLCRGDASGARRDHRRDGAHLVSAAVDMPPAQARRLLVERPADEWKRIVRDDLLAMHPDLDGAIRASSCGAGAMR
jgi:hypothetical protein